jgi:GT2 family glycosyltransferase
MAAPPEVSVIIPYHNEGKLLDIAIASVCAQTYSGALEIIVVDDASEQPPVLGSEHRFPVRLVRSDTNIWLSAARNLGVKHSQANLVCFLDADDAYLPERISSHLEFHRQHPELCLVGGPHITEMELAWVHIPPAVSNCFEEMNGHRCELPTTSFVFDRRVRFNACASYFFHAGMMTVRRDAFHQVNGFLEDIRWGEEWDLGVRLAQIGSVGFVPTPGMRYICRSNSLSSTENPAKWTSAAKVFRSWRKTIPGLPWNRQWPLRCWERENLLLAAQVYLEKQGRAPLALRCAWSALWRSPSVWAIRSVVRMSLHTILALPVLLLDMKAGPKAGDKPRI